MNESLGTLFLVLGIPSWQEVSKSAGMFLSVHLWLSPWWAVLEVCVTQAKNKLTNHVTNYVKNALEKALHFFTHKFKWHQISGLALMPPSPPSPSRRIPWISLAWSLERDRSGVVSAIGGSVFFTFCSLSTQKAKLYLFLLGGLR